MMKSFYLLLFIFAFQSQLFSQVLCGSANEGSSATLTAPPGKVFIEVTFASYGTPNGSCGSFTTSSCHAVNSIGIVEGYLLGKNSATVPATNAVFGDPCQGTVKRLYIQAVYGNPLPLELVSFSGSITSYGNSLNWETTDEKNTRLFEVERSKDGIHFLTIGTVTANNRRGTNRYSFTDGTPGTGASFYRLKQVDIDGEVVYSKIINLENDNDDNLVIFPAPAKNTIMLSGLTGKGTIVLLTLQGKILQQFSVSSGIRTLNIADYPNGVYILKYVQDKRTVYKKVLKQ